MDGNRISWVDFVFDPYRSRREAAEFPDGLGPIDGLAEVIGPADIVRRNDAAAQFASLNFNRRQRVLVAPSFRLLEAGRAEAIHGLFWQLALRTPNIDWLIFKPSGRNWEANLPADWRGGYENVWLGSRLSDDVVVKNVVDDLRHAPARLRFLVVTRLHFDPGELDLSGMAWLVTDLEAGATRNVEGATSMQLQALRSGIPLWHQSAPRSGFFGRTLGGEKQATLCAEIRRRYGGSDLTVMGME